MTPKGFVQVLFAADVGSHSGFHVGDEAMLECNLVMFRRLLPDALFTVASLDPATTRSLYGTEAVQRLEFRDVSPDRQVELQCIDDWMDAARHPDGTLPEALRALLSANLLVISGGGNLSSTWPEHILERLALVRLAKLRKIPVLIVGQTIGPALIGNDRQWVAEILCAADWIGLREASSVALALSLGVPLERIDYQLDDAITLLPVPSPLWPSVKTSKAQGPLIALTLHPVFELSSPNDWLSFLAAELNRVIEATGAHLLFIPHLRVLEDGRETGDRVIGEALAGLLQDPAAMTVMDVSGSAQTLWLTQQADVVVSTRYHPLVFALTKLIPCLGLPTDHYTLVKLHGALSHADCESDLVLLNESRWQGLAERIIELCGVRQNARLQREAWAERLEQIVRAREAGLAERLERLASPAEPGAPVQRDSATLLHALAKIANRPELFSSCAARESALQRIIEHWQATAQEAENYALDLKTSLQKVIEHGQVKIQEAENYALDLRRVLDIKHAEIQALREALDQANRLVCKTP